MVYFLGSMIVQSISGQSHHVLLSTQIYALLYLSLISLNVVSFISSNSDSVSIHANAPHDNGVPLYISLLGPLIITSDAYLMFFPCLIVYTCRDPPSFLFCAICCLLT
jgi:hypothetical protein